MKVTLGEEGLGKTWQAEFPKDVKCVHCKGVARIAFVAHEHMDDGDEDGPWVCDLHSNQGKGGYWLHDCCAVAVYLCCDCLKPTALYNQG